MGGIDELDLIAAAVRETYSGSPWHGPSFRQSVRGVDGSMAAERMPGFSHSIWELALHLKGWMEVVNVRLSGKSCGEPKLGNFPVPKEETTSAWKNTLKEFDETVEQLVESIQSFPKERLDERVSGRGHTYRPMLIGLAWHTLHHTGQISIIKKALKRGTS